MSTTRNYLWQAAIWTMIPVTLFAAMPRIACICATGQQKLFCEQLSKTCGSRRDMHAVEKGMRSCCRKEQLAHVRNDAAAGTGPASDCCRRATTSPRGQVRSQRCCTPVVVAPVFPPVSQSLAMPDLTPMALLVSIDDLLPAVVKPPARESAWNPALPVPDLLIAHQVFLI